MVGGEFRSVAIGKVREDKENARSITRGVTELADSIAVHGVLQPLIGFVLEDGAIQLIAGHRRLAAARLAGLTHVPVTIQSVDSDVAKEIQIVENVQREDLAAIDVAEALSAMVKSGQSVEQVAARVSKSAAWVRRHLALLKLDGAVVDAVRKHQLRFTQAEQVARVLKSSTLEAALGAAKEMAAGTLSRRESAQALEDGAQAEMKTSKASYSWRGAQGRATLAVESNMQLDAVRNRQLQDLVSAVERILVVSA